MVGHRLHRRKAYAVPQAHLRHGAALHFRQQRVEGIPDEGRPVPLHGKPVAGGYPARHGGKSQPFQDFHAMLRLPCGEFHPVHRGHQPNGIAHSGGIHIVLDEFIRHHQTAGGQIRQASGHPGVQDQIHAVFQAQDLRRHGGVYLADAAGAGDDPRFCFIKGNAGHGFKGCPVFCPRQGVQLRRHGKLQSDFHHVWLRFSESSYLGSGFPHFPQKVNPSPSFAPQ